MAVNGERLKRRIWLGAERLAWRKQDVNTHCAGPGWYVVCNPDQQVSPHFSAVSADHMRMTARVGESVLGRFEEMEFRHFIKFFHLDWRSVPGLGTRDLHSETAFQLSPAAATHRLLRAIP